MTQTVKVVTIMLYKHFGMRGGDKDVGGGVAIRKRRQNRLGMLLVTVVVLMLLLVVAVKCMELKQKQEIYLTREAQLQEQIDEQEARADEIEVS